MGVGLGWRRVRVYVPAVPRRESEQQQRVTSIQVVEWLLGWYQCRYDVPGNLPEGVWLMTRMTRVDGEVIARRAVVGVEELLE